MTIDVLFNRRWPKSSLSEDIAGIDVGTFSRAYVELMGAAPNRPLDRPYFVGHSGYPSTSNETNRREEHVAIAMVNGQQNWRLPNGTCFELLDYQVPLKATRSDREIGKIDIFGITANGQAVVVELKVIGHSGGASDPPPVALLEGMRYASIVEANLNRIADEVRETFGRTMVHEKPIVLVVGEADWWKSWLIKSKQTKKALENKAGEIAKALDLSIVFGFLTNVDVEYGTRSKAPRLLEFPKIEYPNELPKSSFVLSNARQISLTDHEASLQRHWWQYAIALPQENLDGNQKSGRPPVASPEAPSVNLMLPDDEVIAGKIESEIQPKDRHRHFRSFRSSQALAQSVFGEFKASGRMDLLSTIPAECGRPAFGAVTSDTSLSMEVDVHTLNEPRSTQLDVYLETDDYRVAVECKFCETEFGKCSRVRPQRSGSPLCDGNYTRQQDRQTRCALSEIGIRYWDLIPKYFAWDANEDHCPCPLLPSYQIVRNVLASIVKDDGGDCSSNGHPIFVYDARHPAYKPNGAADAQLRQAAEACRVPGLIRRVTWQEIARACEGTEEMAWLVEALSQKHGISAAH
ncbi:hypothetical protein N9L47_12560 [Rhodobacteraceae bacterium]|nr:hypothetical protein [Paracoccaceae bacterium]